MCRAPEIVAHGDPSMVEGRMYQSHRCVNCDRWAYECPRCKVLRCDSDLFKSMVGSIPLACRFCAADVHQTYAMGAGGIYGGGGELRYEIVERSD